MNKAKPSEADPTRCAHCGQKIYPTMTARGQEFAHRDSKMLFCTNKASR